MSVRCAKPCFWLLLLAATIVSNASGVVLKSGDGSGNETPPVDDPGFANIGRVGVGTGIYLGNRWVLTANHVGTHSITFGGETFEPITGESVRISNPLGRGLSTNTDMLLFRLEEAPELPELRIGCGDLRNGGELVLMGHGREREADVSAWNVQRSDGSDDDIWTATNDVLLADEVGFLTNSNRTLQWGVAPVTHTNQSVPTQRDGDVISILTSFPRLDNRRNLSRAVAGDSGGPAFRKNGEFWELVGMIYGVTPPKENQPGGSGTVLLQTSTFIANLMTYEEQLRAVAEFGPAPSDFNSDGQIDATDIDHIFNAVNSRDHNCNYDLSGNGIVTRADIDLVLDAAGTLPGDANLDGEIDFPDFLILARSFGDSNVGWAGGDFDGDGTTNFGDFIVLSNAFGESFSVEELPVIRSARAVTVPEPNGMWMAIIGFCFWFANRDGFVRSVTEPQ